MSGNPWCKKGAVLSLRDSLELWESPRRMLLRSLKVDFLHNPKFLDSGDSLNPHQLQTQSRQVTLNSTKPEL